MENNIPPRFALIFSWTKRSSHRGKKEVPVASKPLVSCLWGCGESVNPPKLNIQEVQGALSSRPKGNPSLLPIFQDFFTSVKWHPCCLGKYNGNCVAWFGKHRKNYIPFPGKLLESDIPCPWRLVENDIPRPVKLMENDILWFEKVQEKLVLWQNAVLIAVSLFCMFYFQSKEEITEQFCKMSRQRSRFVTQGKDFIRFYHNFLS